MTTGHTHTHTSIVRVTHRFFSLCRTMKAFLCVLLLSAIFVAAMNATGIYASFRFGRCCSFVNLAFQKFPGLRATPVTRTVVVPPPVGAWGASDKLAFHYIRGPSRPKKPEDRLRGPSLQSSPQTHPVLGQNLLGQ